VKVVCDIIKEKRVTELRGKSLGGRGGEKQETGADQSYYTRK